MSSLQTSQPPLAAGQPGARASNLLGWSLLAVLALLVLGPLAVLIRASFTPAGALPLETWQFTLENFAKLFASSDTLTLLRNTLVYAAGTVSFATVIGTTLAWLTERTDMPGRVPLRIMLFSWLAIPPLVVGFGWILLINPGSGALNVLARSLTGGALSFNLYSMWTLIIVTGFALVPTTYVMMAGLLRNMDPQLENAARLSGAGGMTVARKITIPLLTPGLISVSIYTFMSVIQTFDLPAIIGLTARIPVLSTRVYLLSSPDMGIPNYGLSAALGVLLLALAAGLIQLYFRFVGLGDKYRVVGGRSFRPTRTRLGRWRHPAAALAFTYLFITILPVLIIAWTSLLPFYQVPSVEALGKVSLATFERVLGQSMVVNALSNTALLVVVSATSVMVLSSLVAWLSVRQGGWLARVVDVVAFVPIAIPPIVIVMAIVLLYLRTPLYGTIWVIVLAHVGVYVAFGARTMTSALSQLHKELGDAALVSGASGLTTLRKVILPLVRPQLLNGWMWVAAHSARDLTAPLMLMTSSSMVASTVIWMMWDLPDLPGASAVSVLLVLGLLMLVVPLQVLISRDGERA